MADDPSERPGTVPRIADPGDELRYDRIFPLSRLVHWARRGQVEPADGLTQIQAVERRGQRFPAWARIVGYAAHCIGFALILQPTPLALPSAVVLGLLMGALCVAADGNGALRRLLQTVRAFIVAAVVFSATVHWHFDDSPVRAIAPPLATFLPGSAITIAVVELSTKDVLSGSSRLIAGLAKIAQLAFGILVAAEVADIGGSHLANSPDNRLGDWAP